MIQGIFTCWATDNVTTNTTQPNGEVLTWIDLLSQTPPTNIDLGSDQLI